MTNGMNLRHTIILQGAFLKYKYKTDSTENGAEFEGYY